jgi:hypothetical protein
MTKTSCGEESSAMTDSEPYRLIEWHRETPELLRGRLFTCGRPGRSLYKTTRCRIDDTTIHAWVTGLPGADVFHIVSLLGEKKDEVRYSEFSYYPFRSSEEVNLKPTWQTWLDQHSERRFIVHEYPTIDCLPMCSVKLAAAMGCVLDLLNDGHTVVVVDSGGWSRTGYVCEAMGYKRQ